MTMTMTKMMMMTLMMMKMFAKIGRCRLWLQLIKQRIGIGGTYIMVFIISMLVVMIVM